MTDIEKRLEKLEFNYMQLNHRQVEINELLKAVNKHIEISTIEIEHKEQDHGYDLK